MLDSLVRVSRRVGRVADTDTADASTPNVAGNFEVEPERLVPASKNQPFDRLSATQRAFAPTYYLLGARYLHYGPAV